MWYSAGGCCASNHIFGVVMFTTYYPKSRPVEAMQSDGTPDRIKEIMDWVNSEKGDKAFQYDPVSFPDTFIIKDAEENFIYGVRKGDYVVRLDEGEFFVMQGYHFQEVYNGEWDTV